ncbi:hypothetical protein FOJ82_02895 [Tessaracoccus rhinocerotis]|uniref:CU044_5270 family protein n=1 Tax=Tessaracoccus rhinocerotis TaxID=1689449 RepID=A0A553K565_9ACTN|nr:CU044_5270 family protein [Tessaracoccus rhinocerotis]TRY19844.1 hypothetical protein FOJ82_02895 [Tessaracoccus rhinocerotis]
MNQTFEELMRTADPARDVGPLPPARRAAVLEAATTARPVPIRPGRRPLRWVAAAAALAFVGGAAALQFRGTPAAEARADEVLETAAINATDPAVTPGQYWAVTTSTTGVMGVCETESNEDCYNGYVYRSTRTDYIEVTGSLPSWHVDGEIEVVEVLDERAANPLHPDPNVWTTNLAPNDFPGGWQQTSPAWLAALPRDHELLRERLYAESAQGNDKSAFTYATDLLRSGLVPADLRASLFEVIASIPGTIVTEEVATVDSREGVAIGRIEDGEVKSEIIIDPEVGQVIAERGYSEDPVVRQWDLGTTYDRRLVDSIPQEVSEIAVRQVCTPPTSDNATTCEVE